jgi:hypothetical protein
MMTVDRRQRWETKQLGKVRNHLRHCFKLLKFASTADKQEIEDRVMATMQEEIGSVSDYTIEHGSLLPSFESDADLMVMNILQEQEMWRSME